MRSQQPRRIVIVGAGFGGLTVARRLPSQVNGLPLHVTLIDQHNHHLFQPLLYQVATAALSPADIAAPIRAILRNHRQVDVILGRAHGIDVPGKRVLLEERAVPYDDLVLATGARHSYFGHPGWERNAPGLKSLADATLIRERVLMAFEKAEMELDPIARKRQLTFVIVGGGPTGVEMAGAIAELARHVLAADFRYIAPGSARIILLEAAPGVLATFSRDLAERSAKVLARLGVEVRTGARVEEVDERGVVVSGERIEAETVIWAAGVVASPVASWIGAARDRIGRVFVREDLSIPGFENVFVIGDAAHFAHGQERPLPGVAPVALQQGRYLARLLAKRAAGEAFTEAFRYVDKGSLATVGRSFAIAEFRNLKMGGFVAWLAWSFVHIFYLISFRNRVLVMVQWAWYYVTYGRGARLIASRAWEEPEFRAREKRAG